MEQIPFSVFQKQINQAAEESANNAGREVPNIEDQFRVSNELIRGLSIYLFDDVNGSKKFRKHLTKFKKDLSDGLTSFANLVLDCERNIIQSANSERAAECLMSFLISFASRSATRERLNIFTTNYDRIIEYGAELNSILEKNSSIRALVKNINIP